MGISILAALSLVGISLSAAQAQTPAGAKAGKPGQAGQQGQPGRGGRMGGMMRNPKIAKELGLTDAQQKQLKDIMEKAMAKRKAIREDKSLTDDQKKTKARELGKETNASFEKVLTPEQIAKVKALRKKNVAEGKAKAGAKPAAKP